MNRIKSLRIVSCALTLSLFFVTLTTAQTLWSPTPAVIEWSSDYALHTYFNNRFLESPGNGMSRMYADPMRVHDLMRLRITSTDTYKLERVELVGVAMHDKPVAFTRAAHGSKFLEPRPLTISEERALVELASGETISVHSDKTGRRVVGALRAKQECLHCHAGYKAGDLLGALSYRLTAADHPSPVASLSRMF